jgi:hypothetical protein
MDTTTKAAEGTRATDRIVEALGTLGALLDRTIKEVKLLDADFQERLLQAVHETEVSIQSQAARHLDTAVAESRSTLEAQFKNRFEELSSEWGAERTRLNNEINRLTQTATQWETERARLTTELERLARVQAATQAEAEKAFAAAKAATVSVAKLSTSDAATITKEMERIDGLVKEVTALIEDPTTELSTVIRKNVERAELESYLKGLRFALNGATRK